MAKMAVYSWRISPETKMALEQEAHRDGITVAALLDGMAHEWLQARRNPAAPDSAEQSRLHARAGKVFGSIAGGNPHRAEQARVTVRRSLVQRHGRRRTH